VLFHLLRHCARCAICHSDCDAEDLQKCDGCYPACIGFGYPEKAFGRQHACWRAVVCDSCGPDDGKRFCSECSKPVSKLPMHGAQASFCSLLICPLEQFTWTRHQSAHSSLAVLPSTRMTLPCSRKQIGLQGYMRRPCNTLARVVIAQLLQPLEC
jgi:hypothetical protein